MIPFLRDRMQLSGEEIMKRRMKVEWKRDDAGKSNFATCFSTP